MQLVGPTVARARFLRRTAAATAVTLSHWGRLEAAMALRPGADQEARLNHRVPLWAQALLPVFGLEVDAEGLFVAQGNAYPARTPSGTGRLFVVNHRSAMDIFLTLAFTEGRLVSKHDIVDFPVMGRGAIRVGTLFVDRTSLRSGAAVMREMTRRLAEGQAVSIFPEGTSYPGDEVRPFHLGAFKASERTGAPVIPIGIAYDDEAAVFGDESFADHVERVTGLPRLRVALTVGAPLPSDEAPRLRDASRAAVQALVHRSRQRLVGTA